MGIFLGIAAFILLLIIILLLTPVHINIKKDAESGFSFKIKVLFFELSDDDEKESKTSLNIKKVFGLDKKAREEKNKEKQDESFLAKTTRYSALISDVFKEAASLIKKINIQKLLIDIVCAEEDAADTAISYGRCCAIVLPTVSAITSMTKVQKNAEKINISCNYTSGKGRFDFDIRFFVRVIGLIGALFRIAFKQIKNSADNKPVTKKS